MPRFKIGDVVRVLSNDEKGGWFIDPDLTKDIQKVGKVKDHHHAENNRGIQIEGLGNDWGWFDSEQCEIAQIQVGDRVITEKFEGYPMFVDGMEHLVGKVGIVERIQPRYIYVRHDGDGWNWAPGAVKFALDGVAVEAPKQEVPKKAPPKPKEHPIEVVEDMVAELNKKAAGRPGVASYAIQFKSGEVRWQISDICHARIGCHHKGDGGYYRDESTKEAQQWKRQSYNQAVAITTAVKPFYDLLEGDEDKANYKHYAEYIINRSIFKDCFQPHEDPTSTSVLMNMQRSLHNIAAAAIALREGSEEYGGKVSTFVWLTKQGVSEDAAWVASRFFLPYNGTDGDTYSFREGGAHDTITTMADVEKFFKVYKDGLYMNDVPYAETKEGVSYMVYANTDGIKQRYGRDEGANSLGKKLKKLSNYSQQGEGWNKKTCATAEGVITAAKWIDAKILEARFGIPVKEDAPKPKGKVVAVAKGPARDAYGRFVKVVA